jgi:hypothetical protein
MIYEEHNARYIFGCFAFNGDDGRYYIANFKKKYIYVFFFWIFEKH